jgi:RHS repeat-associated protein
MRNLTVEQQYSPSLDATSEMTGFTTDINAPYTFSSSLPTQVFKVYAKNNATTNYSRIIGEKSYELNDHLGNVRVVISDRKYLADRDDNNTITSGDNFVPEVLSANEYGAFGSILPGRSFAGGGYRYGFNGMESDDEVSGEKNSYDFGARLYNPRIGRWFSRDALESRKPSYSPYQSFKGNPIIFNDPDGNDEYLTIVIDNKKTGQEITLQKTDAISTRVMTDGQGHKDWHSNYYYDYETVVTITIDEEGKQSMVISTNILYENGSKDYDLAFGGINVKPEGYIKEEADNWGFWGEGDGETSEGGYHLTSKSGGISETKTISKNSPESVQMDELLASFKGKGKGISIPDNVSKQAIFKKLTSLTNGILSAGKSSDSNGDSKSKNNGRGEAGLREYTSSGDINNPVEGDTIYTTKNNRQDTIKVDKHRSGGNERIQTGNKRNEN